MRLADRQATCFLAPAFELIVSHLHYSVQQAGISCAAQGHISRADAWRVETSTSPLAASVTCRVLQHVSDEESDSTLTFITQSAFFPRGEFPRTVYSSRAVQSPAVRGEVTHIRPTSSSYVESGWFPSEGAF